MTRALLAALLLSSSLVLAKTTSASLDLTDPNADPNFNRIDVGLSVPLIGASSDETDLSGFVTLDLDINPATDEVSGITATGGNVTATDVTLSRSSFLFGNYNVTSTGLGASITTPNPPGSVDPQTGSFNAEEHDFILNSGTLNIMANDIPLVPPVNDTIDLTTEPITGTGTGMGTLILTPVSSTATSKTYDVTLLFPTAINQDVEVAAGLTATVSASGTVRASGSATVSFTPYEFWTYENDIVGAPFVGDDNGDGVVNGLVWGLGLDATDNPLPNLPIVTTASDPVATITLPPGGSAAPLVVQGAPSPDGPWNPVDGSALSTGVNPIPAGTSGAVVYTFPSCAAGFTRLEVAQP